MLKCSCSVGQVEVKENGFATVTETNGNVWHTDLWKKTDAERLQELEELIVASKRLKAC